MPKTEVKTADADSFAVVAVGASAGGLEAFSQFLHALPRNTGMAFVFIQHLDPKHHSMLSELLAKTTSMPVLEAKTGTKVKPNHIYVIPPNVNMEIRGHRLQLTTRAAAPTLHAPIDVFMRSLAEDRDQKAIGVVLSASPCLGLAQERSANVGTIPAKEHFHIHWSGAELADWQRFDLYADAESAANELVRPHETYVIETFNNDTCQRCQSIHAERSPYRENRHNPAG